MTLRRREPSPRDIHKPWSWLSQANPPNRAASPTNWLLLFPLYLLVLALVLVLALILVPAPRLVTVVAMTNAIDHKIGHLPGEKVPLSWGLIFKSKVKHHRLRPQWAVTIFLDRTRNTQPLRGRLSDTHHNRRRT